MGLGLYSVNCRGELHKGEVLSVDFTHKKWLGPVRYPVNCRGGLHKR